MLVKLKGGSIGRGATYCVPGAGASVTCFMPFIEALDTEGPIIGLQAQRVDGLFRSFTSVESAAGVYLSAITKAHKGGPFRLVGHSFGGWIAFEIARRLHDLGENVMPLLLLDTEPPSPEVGAVVYKEYAALRKFVRLIEQSTRTRVSSLPESAGMEAELEVLGTTMRRERLLPNAASPDLLRNMFEVFMANLNTHYRPAQLSNLDVYHVAATEIDYDDANRRSHAEVVETWRKYVAKFHSVTATGNHVTMLDPSNVNGLGELAAKIWADDRGLSCDPG